MAAYRMYHMTERLDVCGIFVQMYTRGECVVCSMYSMGRVDFVAAVLHY